ncbi:hypothetical protein, partial [Enterobacter hormaechei]
MNTTINRRSYIFGITKKNVTISFSKDYIFIMPGRVILGNDSNLLIVFYVQIMPDDFVMQLHR